MKLSTAKLEELSFLAEKIANKKDLEPAEVKDLEEKVNQALASIQQNRFFKRFNHALAQNSI